MENIETGRARLVSFIQAHSVSLCDTRLYIETSKQVPVSGALVKRCLFYFLRTYASAPQCASAAALSINLLSAECEPKGEQNGLVGQSSQLQTGSAVLRSSALFALCAASAVCDTAEAHQLFKRSLLDALHDPAGSMRQSAAMAVRYYDALLRDSANRKQVLSRRKTVSPEESAGERKNEETSFAELFGRSGIVDRLYSLIRDADMNVAVCSFEALAQLLSQPDAGGIVITNTMIRYLLEKRINDISDWQLVTVLNIISSSSAFSRLLRQSNSTKQSEKSRETEVSGSPESRKETESVAFINEALRNVIAKRCSSNFDCVIDTRLRRAKLTLLQAACDMLVKLNANQNETSADQLLQEVHRSVQRVVECALLYFVSNDAALRADECLLLAELLTWCVHTVQLDVSAQFNVASERLTPQLADSNVLRVAKLRVISKLLASNWTIAGNAERLNKLFDNLKLLLTEKSVRHTVVATVFDWLSQLLKMRATDDAKEGELIAGLAAARLPSTPATLNDPELRCFDTFLQCASQFAEDELFESTDRRLLLVFLERYSELRSLSATRISVLSLVRNAVQTETLLSNANDCLRVALVRVLTDFCADFNDATYLFERLLHSVMANMLSTPSRSNLPSGSVCGAVLRCAVVLFTHEPAEMQLLLGESLEMCAPIVPNRVRFYYALLRRVARCDHLLTPVAHEPETATACVTESVKQRDVLSLYDLRRLLLSDVV